VCEVRLSIRTSARMHTLVCVCVCVCVNSRPFPGWSS
jgi:hypothetical protein